MLTLRTTLASLALAVTLGAQPKSGIDQAGIDTACKPCDDFWRYANGKWIDANPIPSRQARWGTMAVLNEANRERLKVILDSAALSKAPASSPERKIGDLYSACLDTAAIDARGFSPIQAQLAQIAAIKSLPELSAALTRFQNQIPTGPFGLFASPDLKNSKDMIANLGGGAISLPERDYYFKTDPRSKSIRDEFVAHVAKMLVLLGDSPEKAQSGAQAILALETSIAESMMTNVERRDPYSRYHKMDLAAVNAITPSYDWKALLDLYKVPTTTAINVSEPKVLAKIDAQFKALPLDDWKTWLRWRTVTTAAPSLSQPFRDEDFRFSSTILTGVKEQLPRWQQCANSIDRSLGDALGQVFVQKHFPPQAKKRMLELVENLRAALRDELSSAAWLTPQTRSAAVAKLNSFTPKIGYPDRWRDYSSITIDKSKYFESLRAATLNNRLYQIAKIGKPIDRNDWGMTPPTVNAYYNPTMNEIAFPAGILQPPMFDMTADDAANYGAIGAVIGHEMGHGFDDQGSKFDAEGNLKNWWTPDDRKKFDDRAACIINQYSTLDVGDNLRHNGKLVVGEALGDLGGLTLSYKAYQRALNGKPGPVIDGLTADQRFFLAFARVWAAVDRPESMRLRLNTDPHPLPRFRALGTLQNMPEFHKAFGCKPGDPMVRPADSLCKLW